MGSLIKKVFVALILLAPFCNKIFPGTYFERTHLAIRAPGEQQPIIWNKLYQQVDLIYPYKVDGKLQATAFYQRSSGNGSSLGKYHGMYNGMTGRIDDFIGVDRDDTQVLITPGAFIHDVSDVLNYARQTNINLGTMLKDKLAIRPKRKSLGLRLDYVQGLNDFINGLSIRVSLPIAQVKTSENPHSTMDSATKSNLPNYLGVTNLGAVPAALPVPAVTQASVSSEKYSLLDYVAGRLSNSHANNKQATLQKMKIDSGTRSKTGLGDCTVAMSYRFWETNSSRIDLSCFYVLAFSDGPKGDYLLEPITGNGGHRGFGLGLNGVFVIKENEKEAFEVVSSFEYRHLFEANETRAPLFKNAGGETLAWGLYNLGGEHGKQGVFPLANVLTRPYKIKPGASWDFLLELAYQVEGFSIEVGHNLVITNAEKASICSWENSMYGVAKYDYNTAVNFDVTDHAWSGNGSRNALANLRDIKEERLLMDSICTPRVFKHQIFATVGYCNEDFKYPLSFGIGGFKDFTTVDNTTTKEWGIWGKAGINF